MNEDDFKKLVRKFLLREAAGQEHKRLESILDAWAVQLGYEKRYTQLPNGQRPDVLRDFNESVFIGDAKDATNETPKTTQTLRRIDSYMQQFGYLLVRGYHGGHFAIATNDGEVAQEWVAVLNLLAIKEGLSGPDHTAPNFKVLEVNEDTWIVYW